jgi:hypothetical protein
LRERQNPNEGTYENARRVVFVIFAFIFISFAEEMPAGLSSPFPSPRRSSSSLASSSPDPDDVGEAILIAG